MKDPVDHILRPRLPWREQAAVTECGIDATKVKALTREEFFQRREDYGQQRCAMLTCMTCSSTAERWKTWGEDPRQAIEREISWEYGNGYRPRADRGDLLKEELIAIAALIETHSEEFSGTLAANSQRRAWLAKKAAMTKGNKPQPPKTGL